jgi:hypothetical protein
MLKKKQINAVIAIVKGSKDEKANLQANADRWTNGNLSAWLRIAGEKYIPENNKKIRGVRGSSRSRKKVNYDFY